MRKSNARDRILETASELFHQRGYSEVGINEIIAKAETAKASFYQHFPSKEALCEAWLDSIHDRSEGHRAGILNGPGTPAEKIAKYFEELGGFMSASAFRGCPYSNTSAVIDKKCDKVIHRIQAHKCSVRGFFGALTKECFGEGDRATEVADRLFLLYSGATTEAQNLKELWPVEVAKRAARELLSDCQSC